MIISIQTLLPLEWDCINVFSVAGHWADTADTGEDVDVDVDAVVDTDVDASK